MIPEISIVVFKIASILEILFGVLLFVMLIIVEKGFSWDVEDYDSGLTAAVQMILTCVFLLEFVGFFGGILFQWFF